MINLSPATMRKRGASFDLPIAVAVLTALGELSGSRIQNTLIIGEMGLDGSVRKVPGILPIVAEAKEREVRRCIVPEENKAEAALVSGMQVIGVKDLKETIEFLKAGASRRKESAADRECAGKRDRGEFSRFWRSLWTEKCQKGSRNCSGRRS